MGCTFCNISNDLYFQNPPSKISSKGKKSESYIVGDDTNNINSTNNKERIKNLKSLSYFPLKNKFLITDDKELKSILINKLLSNIKGFLLRKKYEEYLKTQLLDHTNDLYFEFIILTKNFKSSKIINNKDNEKLKNIMKIGWEQFYSKDPTVTIKNKINKIKKYNNGLIFKYKNKDFNSSDIEDCIKNAESCYKGSVDLITNKKCGYGELIKIEGIQEIGTFYNDEFCGWNTLVDNNGNLFIGLFNNDLLSSKGLCFNLEKDYKYKGLFKNFKKEIFGEEFFEGNKYKGEFKKDKKNGKGEIIFKNYDIYSGEFFDDKINGFGNYKWNKKKKEYIGNFVNGKIHGNGLLKWGDDMYYKGWFNYGIKEGKGEFGFINKIKYYFIFKNNLPCGKGYYVNKNNKKCEVFYNHGKIVDNFMNEINFLFE